MECKIMGIFSNNNISHVLLTWYIHTSDHIRKNMPAGFRLGLGTARIQA